MSDRSAGRRVVLPVIRDRLEQTRIPSLDGVRALAVFLVILYHFGFQRVNGALGVEIFFTLSGFLITWLLLRENRRTGRISFAGFYARRSLRIFPAFYVYWLLGLTIYFVRGHEIPWPSVAASALYLENYLEGLHVHESNFLSHTWSLAIEEQFYLLWPLLFWRFRHDLKRLSWVLAAVIGCVWIYRATLHLGFSVNQGYIYSAFETRMDQLAVGCLLAVTIFRGSLERCWRLLTAKPLLVFLTMALLFWSASLHGNNAYRFTVGYAIEPLLTAALIVQLIYFADALPGRLFNGRLVSYLGTISYSLYLYQNLTLFTARRLTASLPVPAQLAFALAVTVAFAAVSYHVVEQRFRSWGRSRLDARRTGRRPAPADRCDPIALRPASAGGAVSHVQHL